MGARHDERRAAGPGARGRGARGCALVDVREPDEWTAGHAPGAMHIPLGQLGARSRNPAAGPGVRDLPGRQPLRPGCARAGRSGLEHGERERRDDRVGRRGPMTRTRPAACPLWRSPGPCGVSPGFSDVARRFYGVTRRADLSPRCRATSVPVRTRSAAWAESVMDAGRLAPGIGITTGARASIQARVTCCGETPWASAISWTAEWFGAEVAAWPIPPSGLQGRNAMPRSAQCRSSRFAGPEGRRELVLDAGQVALAQNPPGGVDLGDRRVGDSGQPDLPRVEQFLQRTDRLLVRDRGVGAVELVEADRRPRRGP